MRIYAACLASYNNGRLYGTWIDASSDASEMGRAVNEMLKGSRYPNVTRAEYRCEFCEESRILTNSCGEPFPATIECREWKDSCQRVGEPYASAEEFAIHDSEGLGNLGEYAGLDEVAKRVALAEVAEENDIPLAVLLEWANDMGIDADDVESELSDKFDGKADSWKDFTQTRVEETEDMSKIPDWLQNHIDWESLARDWELGGDWNAYKHDGDIYFFRSH